ncbi:MAG: inositol monophosphatase [Rhodospirillales bacterium]
MPQKDDLLPTLGLDPRRIDDLLRGVAAAEIMPRFRNLARGEITEKRPGEIVTEADTAAERHLAAALADLVPGSVIVGEEGSELAPESLSLLDSSSPVWVIDPVDGTQNFADGDDCFAVLLALRRGGETLAGWIYAPVQDVVCRAVLGRGVMFDDDRPTADIGEKPSEISDLTGCFGRRAKRNLEKLTKRAPGSPRPNLAPRYRCVGIEYFDVAGGSLDFVQYGGRLKPWDHLAGDLIVREAGFTAALTENGGTYAPGRDGIVEGSFLVAPSPKTWEQLRALIS